jgi:hypothetical protein
MAGLRRAPAHQVLAAQLRLRRREQLGIGQKRRLESRDDGRSIAMATDHIWIAKSAWAPNVDRTLRHACSLVQDNWISLQAHDWAASMLGGHYCSLSVAWTSIGANN